MNLQQRIQQAREARRQDMLARPERYSAEEHAAIAAAFEGEKRAEPYETPDLRELGGAERDAAAAAFDQTPATPRDASAAAPSRKRGR